MSTALILLTILSQDRVLVGLHQTGAAGAEPKQSYFVETQLSRPITDKISSIGTLRITTARTSLFDAPNSPEHLAQAAEFQTGAAVKLHPKVEAVAHLGATGTLEDSRFQRQYGAGLRLHGTYQVTVGQDRLVSRRGPTLRIELTQPIDGTPLYLVAYAAIALSGHRDSRDTYRLGVAIDLKRWYRR